MTKMAWKKVEKDRHHRHFLLLYNHLCPLGKHNDPDIHNGTTTTTTVAYANQKNVVVEPFEDEEVEAHLLLLLLLFDTNLHRIRNASYPN